VREHIVADAHNDLLLEVELVGGDNPFAERWLGKLRAGNVRLQACAVAAESDWLPDAALRRALLLTRAFHELAAENAGIVTWIRCREDVAGLDLDAGLGLVLLLEGAEPLGGDPLLVDVFFALGFRIFGLTWSVRNVFADGQNESSDGGLSNAGRALVDRIVRLGGVLDLAHASPRTFDQILERTGDAPVLVSHAGCRAVYDVPRNLSDDQLRALRERDGLLGVMCIPLTVDRTDWSLERLIDHVDHAVSILGVERVGIGSDFVRQLWRAGAISQRMTMKAGLPPGMDGDSAVAGLAGPEDFGNLVRALYGRGYDEASVEAIMSGNLLRFLGAKLPASPARGG
jgi:membrane dipeptidase